MTDAWLGPRALGSACGVSADTVRHYERLGLLPRAIRTGAGYRRFPPDSVERVQLIQRALTIGFSLRELAAVLERREHGDAPCRRVRALVGERLSALDVRLAALTTLRNEMRRLVRDWDARLARTPDGQRARLLDVLAVRPLPATRRRVRAS
jgi:DNA-binding transcriptional MerR regulator